MAISVDVPGSTVGAVLRNMGRLFLSRIWTLYPAIYGQAIPSSFGLSASAKTILTGS